MAYVYSTNFEVNTSYARMFTEFVSTATGAGWTIVKWSDATTVTTGASGWAANSLDASGSWAIIQQPSTGSAPFSGSRQLMIWKRNSIASGDHQWVFNYSVSGFTNTSGQNATTPPTATDEVSAISSYTYTYSQQRTTLNFTSSNSVGPRVSTHVAQIGVSDSSPFSAWIVLYPKAAGVGGSTNSMFRFSFCMQGLASGSYAYSAGSPSNEYLTDQDPYVFSACRDYASVFDDNLQSQLHYKNVAFRKRGQASQSWVSLNATSRSDTGYNHVTGKLDLVPVLFQSTSGSDQMLKGVGELTRLISEDAITNLALLDGTVDRIALRDAALPWGNLAVTPTP